MVNEQELYQEHMDIQRNLQRAELVLDSYKKRVIRTEDQIHKMKKRLVEIEKNKSR
jgi:hypothetical protein